MDAGQLKSAIERVKEKYATWVLGSIGETYNATKDAQNGSTPLAAFILVSCAIDFIAGFLAGIPDFEPGSAGANYKGFVKRYMPGYDPEDVYKNIRCRLAHNYTIGGGIGLIHLNPKVHDPLGSKGNKIINFDDFYSDFRKGAEEYFQDVETNSALQTNFLRRYALGFADVEKIVIPETT